MRFVKTVYLLSVLFSGMALFTGCDELPVDPLDPNYTPKPILFMTQSDLSKGRIQCMSIDKKTISEPGFPIYQDSKVVSYHGYVYIIEQYGRDNIIKFDPSKSDSSGIIYKIHMGYYWNPKDIGFASDTKAYIANMNKPRIEIFNPLTGEILNGIDISSYTYAKDSNVSPYACDLQMVGTDLYAMLQRRNGDMPGAQTLLLKINTLTDLVTDTIQLINKNGNAFVYYDGALYVTNTGDLFEIGDGAIEKVNLADKVVTEVISETELGGNPYMIVHKSGSVFYITNYIEWGNVPVMEIDVSSGIITNTLPDVKDAFGGIFFDKVDNTLYVGERDPQEAGVRIFRNNLQIGNVIKAENSLPPTSLCVFKWE